jgi:hypothetical protein
VLGSIGDEIGAFFAEIISRFDPFRFDPFELGEGARPGRRPRGRATVPDVRGLNVDEARHALSREGLRLEVHRLQEQPAPVMGTVVDQNPEPGKRHRRAEPVMIYVQHLRDP